MSSKFSIGYTCSWSIGLALTALVALKVTSHREEPPPVFEFGGHVSVVSLRASNGKYLEVSRDDGLLRATASSGKSMNARFRVHVLSAATVDGLRLAGSSIAPWLESTGGMISASGCRCTGTSNEHGFGRYCHPWETADQTPWCYVHSTCPSAVQGSFGRKHDVCTLLNRFDDFQFNASTPTDELGMTAAGDAGELTSRELTYVAPPGCPCSGYRSALGYGSQCRGWEYEGQTPWCYVFDNCSLASAQGGTGSFGHRFLDCVLEDPSRRLQQGEEPSGRRLQQAPRVSASAAAGASASLTSRVVSVLEDAPAEPNRNFPRRAADEDALLERVERQRQPHVALVSLATEGFVTVEMPPHRLALRPHARTDALSLRGVFSFLPSGAVMALGTNALFNLCEDLDAPPDAHTDARAVCTGYVEEGVAHPRLLRTSSVKTSRFKVEDIARQAAAKPKTAQSVKGKTSKGRG